MTTITSILSLDFQEFKTNPKHQKAKTNYQAFIEKMNQADLSTIPEMPKMRWLN